LQKFTPTAMPFVKTLENYAPISNACKVALSAIITSKQYKKKTIILQPGNINTKIYFIETGLARVYYDTDTDTDIREIVSWFGYEGGFLCSVRSFLSQKPSLEAIEVLEDSRMFAIEYNDLQRLFEEYPELNLVFRLIHERYLQIYDTRTAILRERNPHRRSDPKTV
jgi:CRP/FNR family transcriptional regulator, anaerobic regulatory protein